MTSEFDYDKAGNIIGVVDPYSRRTEYRYDAMNRLIGITLQDPDDQDPFGGVNGPESAPETHLEYDALGRLISERDDRGNLTRYEYDASHNLTKIIAPLGATTMFVYGAAGQLVREIDPLGRVTRYTYDGAGRLASVQEPGAAAATTYRYDTLGNLRFVDDPLGHTTEYQYDARGRMVKQVDANDAETVYDYNDASELVALTDPVGNTTSWTYDFAGRVVAETNELDDTESYKYDAFGRVIQVTDRNERVTTYVYDSLSRVKEERWYVDQADLDDDVGAPLHRFTFTYDSSSGELITVMDYNYVTGETESWYEFYHDRVGNVTKTVNILEGIDLDPVVTFKREFDAGRLEETSAHIGTDYEGNGGAADFVNEYHYDALDRLTRVTQGTSSSGDHEVASKRVDFTYNKASQLTSLTRYASLTTSTLVAASVYSYDTRGRLAGLTHKKNSTAFADYGFGYDDANRLTGFTNSVHTAESATYTYDDRGQLNVVNRNGTLNDEAYNYDFNGNRQEYEIAVAPNNQLQRDDLYSGATFEYDAEGNVTRRYDNEGYTEYTWDHRNRLVAAIDYDDNGTPSNDADDFTTQQVDYVYDVFNQLVKRTVDSDGNEATTADRDQTFFLYDQGQVALEFHKAGAEDAEVEDLSHRYLWNPAAVDQLLADERVLDVAASGVVLWALTDHLGSVRDVVDSAGRLRIHKNYDAFGNVLNETHLNTSGATVTAGQSGYVDEAFGFTGRYFDKATGLQNNLNRWYDSETGRWLSEDPIGFAGGDANLYRYVNNSPGMYTDPVGLKVRNAGWGMPTFGDYLAYLNPFSGNEELDTDVAVGMCVAGGVGVAAGGAAAIVAAGPAVLGGYIAEELAEAAFEEVTGIPIIVDPGDIIEAIGKRGAKRASKKGIYEFPDNLGGGKPYVGQSGNLPQRLGTHTSTGRMTPGTECVTPVDGGKTAREIAEHNRIQQLTGGQKAKNSTAVSNQRDPIGPERRPGLGLPEPRD